MSTTEAIAPTVIDQKKKRSHPTFAYTSRSLLYETCEADGRFLAGTASGTTKCLVGHPFDTIKTRLQTNPAFSGPWECLMRTLKLEGVRGLYKVPFSLEVSSNNGFWISLGF